MIQLVEKKIIVKALVPRPNVFKTFSSNMCGVDKHDWWASKYAKTMKAKNGSDQYLQKF